MRCVCVMWCTYCHSVRTVRWLVSGGPLGCLGRRTSGTSWTKWTTSASWPTTIPLVGCELWPLTGSLCCCWWCVCELWPLTGCSLCCCWWCVCELWLLTACLCCWWWCVCELWLLTGCSLCCCWWCVCELWLLAGCLCCCWWCVCELCVWESVCSNCFCPFFFLWYRNASPKRSMVPASPNFVCNFCPRAIPKGLPFGLCL